MNQSEEHRLIRGAIAGDRDATEALIRIHQASLYNYIYKLSAKHHLAEDVVQEAYLRALTNLEKFDPRFRFSTWLFTIARRVFLNTVQKLTPRSNAEFFEGLGDEMISMGHEQRVRQQDSMALDRALQHLPFVQRNVLVLFYAHEATITSIAEQLGLPEGTVKSHLHRGRTTLRAVMDQFEQTSLQASTRDEEARS
jgi:RNA polymerase sigma-70 factor, ECF subfamily